MSTKDEDTKNEGLQRMIRSSLRACFQEFEPRIVAEVLNAISPRLYEIEGELRRLSESQAQDRVTVHDHERRLRAMEAQDWRRRDTDPAPSMDGS